MPPTAEEIVARLDETEEALHLQRKPIIEVLEEIFGLDQQTIELTMRTRLVRLRRQTEHYFEDAPEEIKEAPPEIPMSLVAFMQGSIYASTVMGLMKDHIPAAPARFDQKISLEDVPRRMELLEGSLEGTTNSEALAKVLNLPLDGELKDIIWIISRSMAETRRDEGWTQMELITATLMRGIFLAETIHMMRADHAETAQETQGQDQPAQQPPAA